MTNSNNSNKGNFYSKFVEKKQKIESPKIKKSSFVKEKKNFNKAAPKKTEYEFSFDKSLFSFLDEESKKVLDSFDKIVQDVRPLNSKQFCELPYAIRDLSHSLTDERNERRVGYMNGNSELSAYIRYFQWWNLYRLSSLFCGLGEKAFDFVEVGDVLLDLGSGPLTVPIALYLALPSLRKKNLTFYCLDMSQNALSIGEELFLSVVAKFSGDNIPWRIVRVKGSFGEEIRQKAKIVFCANMFNELSQTSNRTLEEDAKYYSKQLFNYSEEKSAIFLIEPGIPRSGRFVSLMRDAFLRKGYQIVAPCPHSNSCAMPGLKTTKWCHFTLDTKKAPKALCKLSDAAHLTKDRATISFVFAKKGFAPQQEKTNCVRLVSDLIDLPFENCGRYACSSIGLTLLTGQCAKSLFSGGLVEIKTDLETTHFTKDKKSSAITIPLKAIEK